MLVYLNNVIQLASFQDILTPCTTGQGSVKGRRAGNQQSIKVTLRLAYRPLAIAWDCVCARCACVRVH